MTEETKKAVISNRIYLKVGALHLAAIRKELTYKIEKKIPVKAGAKKPMEIIRDYKILAGNIISIPQGRLDLIPEGYTLTDKRVSVPYPFPTPVFPLREDQLDIYNQVEDTCFINALVGWGKTFTALYLAYKLGQKTLIVTPTTILRDQWITEVRKLFDMEPGSIGSKTYNIEPTIVIGNVQSVSKHSLALSKEFGTIILDEAHHVPATTFSTIIDSSYARYRIGLSGTMSRTDGKHILIRNYFGDTIFKPEKNNTVDPKVRIINSGIKLQGDNWAAKVNNLLYDHDYQNYIAAISNSLVNKGHKVLIIADRVEFLVNVKEILGEKCMLVTGETSLEDRQTLSKRLETGEATCIAGSRQIFSEGISVDILSAVVLAAPLSSESLLEQIIGRIMRIHKDKPQPEVIDINFSGFSDKKQNLARLGLYIEKGWEITSI